MKFLYKARTMSIHEYVLGYQCCLCFYDVLLHFASVSMTSYYILPLFLRRPIIFCLCFYHVLLYFASVSTTSYYILELLRRCVFFFIFCFRYIVWQSVNKYLLFNFCIHLLNFNHMTTLFTSLYVPHFRYTACFKIQTTLTAMNTSCEYWSYLIRSFWRYLTIYFINEESYIFDTVKMALL